jgi:hypothetical protein
MSCTSSTSVGVWAAYWGAAVLWRYVLLITSTNGWVRSRTPIVILLSSPVPWLVVRVIVRCQSLVVVRVGGQQCW